MARIKVPASFEANAVELAAELAAELTATGPVLCGILTRYVGATDTRGARIVAELAGAKDRLSVAVSYPYELDELGRHTLAALALATAMNRHEAPLSIDNARIVGACATHEGYAFTIATAR